MNTALTKPKKLNSKSYIKFVTDLSSKIVPKDNKTNNYIPCGEFFKSKDKTIQATNGRQGIIIHGLYNENYADKIINPITKEEIINFKFPDLETVLPDYTSYNSDYKKVTVTIPKFRSKKSKVNVIKTSEGIEFVELHNSSEENIDENLCFQVDAEKLQPFSGHEVNLYFNSSNLRAVFVIESLPEIKENFNIKFTYVTLPNYIKRR